MSDEDTNAETVQTGIRQGVNKSRSLFTIFLDYALRICKHKSEEMDT